jgi:hypothetical protein
VLGEVVDRGDVDHGLGAGGQGLVVSGGTPVQHDPTNASFDNPAPFGNVEAANSWVSVDDFDVDSEAGAVFDGGVLEAGVDPALGDGRVGLLGLVEELDSDGVLGLARGGDGRGEDQCDRVGEDAPFPADDLLGGVGSLAGQGHVGGGHHALGVDHGSGRLGLATLFHAGQAGQVVVELGEDSLVAPGCVVGVDGAVVREVVREVFPGDSGAVDIEECVEYVEQVDLGRLSGGPAVEPGFSPGRQRRLD